MRAGLPHFVGMVHCELALTRGVPRAQGSVAWAGSLFCKPLLLPICLVRRSGICEAARGRCLKMATRRPTKRMTDLKGLLKRLDELREELGDEKGTTTDRIWQMCLGSSADLRSVGPCFVEQIKKTMMRKFWMSLPDLRKCLANK